MPPALTHLNTPALTAQLHSAFYRFTPIADPVAVAAQLRERASGLWGAIVLATEGINGTVAGPASAVAALEAALQQPDFLGGALAGMPFKRSACSAPPFGRLKVSVKPEIVALALPETPDQPLPAPDEHDDSHLSPQAWRALLDQPDVVLLDNRNHFEFRLGRFRGAIDPGVHNFRDFVAYVQAHAPAWAAAQRPVAMYRTGGSRCEKAAVWMAEAGVPHVLQLDGGILKYFEATGSAPHWHGECFVFDEREALDVSLQAR